MEEWGIWGEGKIGMGEIGEGGKLGWGKWWKGEMGKGEMGEGGNGGRRKNRKGRNREVSGNGRYWE